MSVFEITTSYSLYLLAGMFYYLFHIKGRKVDVFEPINFITFLCLLYFLARFSWLLFNGANNLDKYIDFLLMSNFIVCLGYISMVAGASFALNRNIESKPLLISINPSGLNLVLLFSLGFLIVILYLSLQQILAGEYMRWLITSAETDAATMAKNFIVQFGYLLVICLVSLYHYTFSKYKKITALLLLLTVLVSLPYYTVGGERKYILYAILIPMIFRHFCIKRFNPTYIAIGGISLMLFFFLVFYPSVALLQKIMFLDGDQLSIRTIVNGFSDYDIYAARSGVETFMNRFVGIDSIAATISNVPQVENYQYGRTLLKFFLVFFPTLIIPDKQEMLMLGELMNQNHYGVHYFSDWLIMPFNEFYLNFHLIGVVFGMFLFGYFLTRVYLKLSKSGSIGALIYIPFFLAFSNIENDLGIVWGMFFRHVFIFLSILFVCGALKILKTKNTNPSISLQNDSKKIPFSNNFFSSGQRET